MTDKVTEPKPVPNCSICGKPLDIEHRNGLKVTAHFHCIFEKAYGKDAGFDDIG